MKSSDDGLYTVPGDYVILMIQMLKLDIQIHHAITRGSILQSCYIIFAIIAHYFMLILPGYSAVNPGMGTSLQVF